MSERDQIISFAEQTEADVLADVITSAPADVAARIGLVLLVDSGVVASLISTVDSLSLNRVVGLGSCSPATEAQLDRILELGRTSGVRRLFIQLSPTASPEDLIGWLEARNGRTYNRWVRLWLKAGTALELSNPTDFNVTEIDPVDADVFARVVREAYGFPPAADGLIAAPIGRPGWKHYGAWDGDDLVATGAIYATRKTAWLGFAATRSSHRRRGAQSALIAERCRYAAVLGCERIITDTAEELPDRPVPSYHNLIRLGFTEAYRRQNYVIETKL